MNKKTYYISYYCAGCFTIFSIHSQGSFAPTKISPYPRINRLELPKKPSTPQQRPFGGTSNHFQRTTSFTKKPLHQTHESSLHRNLKTFHRNMLPLQSHYMQNAELIDAVSSSHIAAIERAIKQGADVNSKNKHRNRPIHSASTVASALVLLAYGADINATNRFGETPLLKSIEHNNLPLMKALIRRGADTATKKYYGITPLFFAVMENNIGAVDILLNAGAAVNTHVSLSPSRGFVYGIDARSWSTPLHKAVQNDNCAIARLLLEHGAHITLRDITGRRARSYIKSEAMQQLFNDFLEGKIEQKSLKGSLQELD